MFVSPFSVIIIIQYFYGLLTNSNTIYIHMIISCTLFLLQISMC